MLTGIAKKQNGKERLYTVGLPLLMLVLELSAIVAYVFVHGRYLINSDASAELILSNLLNELHEPVMTDQWYYSTELRVLNTQLIYRIALLIFPGNWQAARILSIVVLLLILLLCGWFLLRSAGLSRAYLWWLCVLIAPFGQWYGNYITYNCYYVPHVALSFISIGLMLRLLRADHAGGRAKQRVLALLLGLVCLVAGLGGVRQLMICYAPAFLAAFFLWLLAVRNEGKDKKSFREFLLHSRQTRCLILGFYVLLLGGIGFLINSKILSRRYFFRAYGGSTFKAFDLDYFLSAFSDLLGLFGWTPDVPMLSAAGIGNVLAVCAVLAIVYFCVRAVRRAGRFDFAIQYLIAFTVILTLADLFVFSTIGWYMAPYWVPVMPFILLLAFIGLVDTVHTISFRKIGIACVCIWFCFCSLMTMKNPIPGDMQYDENDVPVAAFLKGTDYTQGIATMWEADVLTELTNGPVEMWMVKDWDNLTVDPWLQKTSHSDALPEGKFFLVYNPNRAKSPETTLPAEGLKDYEILNTGKRIVYGFDSVQQYFAAYEKAKAQYPADTE